MLREFRERHPWLMKSTLLVRFAIPFVALYLLWPTEQDVARVMALIDAKTRGQQGVVQNRPAEKNTPVAASVSTQAADTRSQPDNRS